MRKIGCFWRSLLWIKGSLIVAAIGGYFAFENHEHIKEAEYTVFDKKQVIEQNYFQDPPGLKTTWESNNKGRIESYLEYTSNGKTKKVEVLEDMLPKETTMINGLKERFKDNKIYGWDMTSDYLKLANTDLKIGEKPTAEQLDEIIDQSLNIFKSAYIAKNNLLDSEAESLNNFNLEIKKSKDGKNELYLKFKDNMNNYERRLDSTVFIQKDANNKPPIDVQKGSIYKMFEFLDSIYAKNEAK
ncbi:MAG: hypothetical protein KJ583_03240 [Nanoarchaeota archaeon]|nr:hypothetical protein [Nanoarchaeota archaeon]MBU1269392.1 hypothetical protein [Nanoarchaeota archaeon]MBU1604309.1 hypothetical protein [Nanoarchaeota archaeon]MBU2442894.1 hypothetical protein [Nanoarchaeota archaeon]